MHEREAHEEDREVRRVGSAGLREQRHEPERHETASDDEGGPEQRPVRDSCARARPRTAAAARRSRDLHRGHPLRLLHARAGSARSAARGSVIDVQRRSVQLEREQRVGVGDLAGVRDRSRRTPRRGAAARRRSPSIRRRRPRAAAAPPPARHASVPPRSTRRRTRSPGRPRAAAARAPRRGSATTGSARCRPPSGATHRSMRRRSTPADEAVLLTGRPWGPTRGSAGRAPRPPRAGRSVCRRSPRRGPRRRRTRPRGTHGVIATSPDAAAHEGTYVDAQELCRALQLHPL